MEKITLTIIMISTTIGAKQPNEYIAAITPVSPEDSGITRPHFGHCVAFSLIWFLQSGHVINPIINLHPNINLTGLTHYRLAPLFLLLIAVVLICGHTIGIKPRRRHRIFAHDSDTTAVNDRQLGALNTRF